MARKSPKCPPTVDPHQFGCVWNFSGMFDHHHRHHHRHPNRKLLLDDHHGRKAFPGSGHAAGQVQMVNFDEQLRNINLESKKNTAIVKRSIEGDTSSSRQARKNDSMEMSFWKKIKSRCENPNKKKKNPSSVEGPIDVGCRCSYLQPHSSSTSKRQIIKHTRFSFSDVTKKLRNEKKVKNTRKTRACEASEGGNATKPEILSIVSFSKQREPDVFVEARRHLAERLRQVVGGEGEASSSKQAARTLERVLLCSPVRDSMPTFSYEPEGTRGQKTCGSSPLMPSASGFLDITDANNFLQGDSKFSHMGSDPGDISTMGGDACIDGPQLELSLDVFSSKADCICKSETMDNDQFRENPSPVSVLESFFADNIGSPTSTIESADLQTQPHRLNFEEHQSQTSSPPYPKTSFNTFMEDRRFISAYVNEIYQASQSNWDDFLSTGHPSRLSCDKLLHDCIKEVLVNSCSPGITFVYSKIPAFSLENNVINEVMEQIEWHNGLPGFPRTLDQLVGRDIAKSGKWVDIKSHSNDIVFQVVDETLQELIMEVIFEVLV